MARIKITHSETGEVREVEELVLTSHFQRRGWSKIIKFEPKAVIDKFPADDEQKEAHEKEKEEVQVEKPKRGRKPKSDK